jgi:DNA-binding response OmpR family regulator
MESQPHILVVDDENDTLGLIELTLMTAGFRVKAAASGKAALDQIKHESFDLVLLDLMMPNLSGLEVLQILQTGIEHPPPVIVLTAKNDPEDRRSAEALGAAGFMTKPTTRGQLLDSIRAVLDHSSQRDADG